MKWIVNWNPDAENDLISWWVSQPNRTEITRVADKIEDLLVKAPLEFSQELVEGLFFWKYFHSSLILKYLKMKRGLKLRPSE